MKEAEPSRSTVRCAALPLAIYIHYIVMVTEIRTTSASGAQRGRRDCVGCKSLESESHGDGSHVARVGVPPQRRLLSTPSSFRAILNGPRRHRALISILTCFGCRKEFGGIAGELMRCGMGRSDARGELESNAVGWGRVWSGLVEWGASGVVALVLRIQFHGSDLRSNPSA